MIYGRRFLYTLCGLLACGGAGCGASSTSPVTDRNSSSASPRLVRPSPRRDAFVGSQQCQECHSEISRRYAKHPMAHTMRPAVAENVGDNDAGTEFSPHPHRKYRVERTSAGVFHHEVGLDAEGKVVYDQAVPIRFAVGSGRRGVSYVVERGGLLFMSPISWYAAKGRWDLSPEYDALTHPRFERPANDRCLNCHSGRLSYSEDPDSELAQRYREPIFSELAIGCERCHGPGRDHIAHRRRKNAAEDADPIVNPSRLTADRRDAVCNQCHLNGEATFLRFGRSHSDFRPGDRLSDIWTVFVAGTGVDDLEQTRAVSHTEQMVASRCYKESGGRLGCISCHDPHEIPDEAARERHYNTRCATCHGDDGCSLAKAQRERPPAQGSCIDCHMPRLPANDVPHTTQTDHRVVRQPGNASRATPQDVKVDPMSFAVFDNEGAPLNRLEEDRARGLFLTHLAGLQGSKDLAEKAEHLLRSVRQAAPDDIDTLDALGFCAAIRGRMDLAEERWRSAVTVDPRRQDPLFSLARLAMAQGDSSTAVAYFEHLLKRNPWSADYHLRYSRALSAALRHAEALTAASKSAELNPSRSETWEWRATLLRNQGRAEEAAENERTAQRLMLSGPDRGSGAMPPEKREK